MNKLLCLVISLLFFCCIATPYAFALLAPGGLTANAFSTEINLSWNCVANATGYQLDYSVDDPIPFSRVGSVTNCGYADTNVRPNTRYFYRVRAYNSTSRSVYSTVLEVKTQGWSGPIGALSDSSSQYSASHIRVGHRARGADTYTLTTNGTTVASKHFSTDLKVAQGSTSSLSIKASNAQGYFTNASLNVSAAGVSYHIPIVITSGGTYTGNWESTDPYVPAVTVLTSKPVTIINSNIRSKSACIWANYVYANLTVMNSSCEAVNPNVQGKYPGRFVDAEGFVNIDLEHNYMDGTSGIYLYDYKGDHTSNKTVKVLYNKARNINGRYSNGHGGFTQQAYAVQFVQLNRVRDLGNIKIGWNEVINDPNSSASEDVISVFKSSGTSASPIKIYSNYIQGSYSPDPAHQGFSGGGIMSGDGNDEGAAWINTYNNIIVSTVNYGLAVSEGNHIHIFDNVVVSSGLLPDGTRIKAQNVGIYAWNSGNHNTWGQNSVTDNTVGWVGGPSARNDYWLASPVSQDNNSSIKGPVTLLTEQAEHDHWLDMAEKNDIIPGPNT